MTKTEKAVITDARILCVSIILSQPHVNEKQVKLADRILRRTGARLAAKKGKK